MLFVKFCNKTFKNIKVLKKCAVIHGTKGKLKFKEPIMGMAASQARLLAITARIHDVEFQAQSIQAAKIRLAMQEDQIYEQYLNALEAQSVANVGGSGIATGSNKRASVPTTFNSFNEYAKNNAGKEDGYYLTDSERRVIVDKDLASKLDQYYNQCEDGDAFAMVASGLTQEPKVPDTAKDIINFLQTRTGGDQNKQSSYVTEYNGYKERLAQQEIGVSDPFDIDGIKNAATAYNQKIQSAKDDEKEISDWELEDPATRGDRPPEPKIPSSELEAKQKAINDLAGECETFKNTVESLDADALLDEIVVANNSFSTKEYKYYEEMFDLIKENGKGYTTLDKVGGKENNSEWFSNAISDGTIYMGKYTTDSKNDNELDDFGLDLINADTVFGWTNGTDNDSTDLTIAETEFERKLKAIDKKEQRYDMQLSRLETERQALTTEYDSLKKVISDNIERTFGIFS